MENTTQKKRLFDIGELKQKAVSNFSRFPVSGILIVITTIWSLLLIDLVGVMPNCVTMLYITLLLSVFVLIPLRQLSERLSNNAARVATLVLPIVALYFLVYYVFHVSAYNWSGMYSLPLSLALLTCIVLGFFSVVSIGHSDDVCYWKYFTRIIGNAAVSFLVGLVVFGGISLFFLFLNLLLDIHISGYAFGYLGVVCAVLIAPSLFVVLMPSREDTADSEPRPLKPIINNLVHIIILGLLGLYIVLLYIFGLKIIITWQLPNGYVSVLVSICMAVMLVFCFLVYPNTLQEEARLDRKLMRLLPIVMLPLVIMMTVGIIRRFCDYGPTILRFWLLLANIWYYAVCIYMIFSKKTRLSMVFLSFGLTFLFFSIGPWSIYNITLATMRHKIASIAGTEGIELPIKSKTDFDNEELVSLCNYVVKNFSEDEYTDIIDRFYHYRSYVDSDNGDAPQYSYYYRSGINDLRYDRRDSIHAISGTYSQFARVTQSQKLTVMDNVADSVVLRIASRKPGNESDTLEFAFSFRQRDSLRFVLCNGSASLIITDFESNILEEPERWVGNDSIDAGYLDIDGFLLE